MSLKTVKILIVDDQEQNVQVLERLLRDGGYQDLERATDSRRVLALYQAFQPDLILLDLQMPHLDGLEVMKQLAPRVPDGDYLPILMLTGDLSREAREQALSLGAKDFVTKPFDQTEVLLRIRNLLETRLLQGRLRDQNERLETMVEARTRDLEQACQEILERLALAAEYRDDATGEHTKRVGEMSATLAQALQLPGSMVELIRRAAPLHDVGKIAVADAILLKPDKLTPEEFDLMKTHVTVGGRIVSGSRFPLLQLAEDIALYHHERWDGSGYAGLRGEAIPLAARIVTVADVFDALTHERPYKTAWPLEEAMAEIQRQGGRQFDPKVVEAFGRVLEDGVVRMDSGGASVNALC